MLATLEPDMDERTDRERLIALEMAVDSLRAVLAEQRTADREVLNQAIKQLSSQVITLASGQDKYAQAASVEKLEVRVGNNEKTVNELKEITIPRAEVQLRLDGVAARQETMAVGIQKLDQNLVRLSDEWTAQESNSRLTEERSYRKRNAVIALIAAVTGVAGVVVSIVLGSHHPNIEVVTPSTSPQTTVPVAAKP